jgi:hypothetical protein
LFLAAGIARNTKRSFAFLEQTLPADIVKVQQYSEPLQWLQSNAPAESVVWSNDAIAEYVPIVTSHYNFFIPAAVLQIVPTSEIEDRYLLSRFQAPSTTVLHDELLYYGGAGRFREQPAAHNRSVTICQITRQENCGELVDTITLAGDEYFTRLESRGVELRSKWLDGLQHYGVAYLIINTQTDSAPEGLPIEELWRNDRFVIYGLPRAEDSGE